MVRSGESLIGPGTQHLPAQVVVHGRLQDHRHVGDRALVGLVIQSHAVGEVGGVRDAKLLQLFVHQRHERLLGARHISGQPQCRVRTGGEDGAVEQLTHRDRFVNHQPHHAAPVDIAVVGDVDGHGEGVVQLRFCDVLSGHQNRQDLRHGGGRDHSIRVFLRQDRPGVQVNQDRAAAGKVLSQLDRVRAGHGPSIGLRRRGAGDGCHLKGPFGLNHLRRRLFNQLGSHGHQAYTQNGQQPAGHQTAKQPPPLFPLLLSAGLRPLGPPGGPLLVRDNGLVLLVHVGAPI